MAKVLIIDDDDWMRRMLSRTLAAAQHQVLEAANGLDGVRKFRAEAPDIIITDIVMPEQEGIETIREIRAGGSKVAIVAISGGGTGDGALYLTIAEELGADAVLAKPFRPAELVELVEHLLNRDDAAG
jgi:DNA-binding response OmpR family regulator